MGLIVIMHAVIFVDDISTWNAKPPSSKTWDSFQAHFITAQTTYKANRPTVTSAILGYTTEQANAVFPSHTEQDLEAANAYITDLEATVASTQQANQVTLPSTTSSTNDDALQLLLTKFKELEAEVKAAKSTSSNSNGTDGNNKKKNKQKEKRDRKYCWTHGACAHDGEECNNRNEGHKTEATFDNMLGGSTKDCFWLKSTPA